MNERNLSTLGELAHRLREIDESGRLDPTELPNFDAVSTLTGFALALAGRDPEAGAILISSAMAVRPAGDSLGDLLTAMAGAFARAATALTETTAAVVAAMPPAGTA